MSDLRAEFNECDQFGKGQRTLNASSSDSEKTLDCVTNLESKTKEIKSSKSTNGTVHSGNQEKYFGNLSAEFQSLKLESIYSSTMEELKLVSANFSKLLDQENAPSLPSRYQDAQPGSSLEHLDSKSISDDENTAEHFLSQQTSVFDQMREFLLAQQMCLKQNLEVLHSNTIVPRREIMHSSADGKNINLDDMNQNEEFEALRQWGSSSTGKTRDEIQICPVCGMEFEVNENPDALEEHVASHWSSSEPL